MPQKPEPKIKAEGIVKIFGKEPQKALEYLNSGYSREEVLQKTDCVIGVNQVSFEVDEAETFVVMGLSGSGKSTLIRCINRLIMPTQGSIALDGEDIVTASTQRLRDLRQQKLGMVFQHFSLFESLSVAENIQLALPGAVVLAEPAVLVAIRIGFPVLLPEQEQGDVLAPEFIVDSLPIRNASGLCRQIRWWREQPLLQLGFTQILWQRPAKLRLSSTPQILAHSGATDAAGCGNLSVAKPSLPLEAKDFFDFTHG